MPLPTFLIIGAPRSGTTSLYHYLAQHPDVYMSPEKEPNFFVFDGRECRFAGPDLMNRRSHVARTFGDYCHLFGGSEPCSAVGEASTQYLYSSHAARRIALRLPEAKLVAILRHPVERAYSSYLHLRGLGEEPAETFERALELEEQRKRDMWWPTYFYVDKGMYYRQLQAYREFFPPERLRIYTYEDLRLRKAELLRDLFTYLGVDPTFKPQPLGRVNASGAPRAPWIHRTLTRPSGPKRALKRLLPGPAAEALHQALLRMTLRRPPLAPRTRACLLERFQDDTRLLQGLLGRDLSPWLA